MWLRFFISWTLIWWTAYAAAGQRMELNWQTYRFKDFAVDNVFPQPARAENIIIDHPYARKETVECVDPVTKSIYRLSILHHAGIYERNPTEAFFKQVARNWKDPESNEFLRTDFLTRNNRKAFQVISKHEKEGFSIWQISKAGANLYVHEIINKSGDFDKKVVDQFVESLVVNDPGEPQYVQVRDTVAAIAYAMPARPEAKRRTFDASHFGLNREVVINSNILSDNYQNFNYVVLFRDNPAGIVYEDIDTTLNEYQRGYEQQFDRKAKKARRVLVNGYHTLELSFELSQTEVEMAIILRGNRVYVIMVEQLPEGDGLQQRKNQFFSSVQFLPFIHTKRKPYRIRDSLFIDFPTPPLKDTAALYTYPYEYSYSLYALDTLSGVSYTLDDYQLSPYFSTTNYDSLLQADYDSLLTTSLVISVADTIFQGGRAHYVVYQEEGTDIYLYELFFYRGPHYFNLIVIGNREYTPKMAWDYFESFRFDRPEYKDSDIAYDKTEALWGAMESRDSATSRQAKFTLNNRPVKVGELPKVYDFLQRDTDWDTITYPKIKRLMFSKLVELKKPESLPFLEKLYENSAADTVLRKQILETLVRFQSTESLNAFFQLAGNFDPLNQQGYEYWQGFRDLEDTLGLAAQHLEGWLSLITHRSLRYYTLDLLDDMLKDSLIQPQQLTPSVELLLEEGRRIIREYNLLARDTVIVSGEIYDLRKINDLLAKLPQKESILAFIREQFAIRALSLLRSAVKTSLSLKYIPPDSILTKIYETAPGEWYSVLQQAKNAEVLDQMPSERATQSALVRSYMHYILEYDWESLSDLEIIDQRPMSKSGKRYQVYILRFRLPSYDGYQYGLCTQPEDTSELQIPPDFYDYTYEEDVPEQNQIKKLLERFVEWERKE